MKFISNILFLLILFSWQVGAQNLGVSAALKRPVINNIYTFNYTGAIQQFIVPNRVTAIQINAIGAKGGTGGGGMAGGSGANITSTFNVTPGQILYIVVGGAPGQSHIAKYGFAGNGGIADAVNGFGGAGGGLSGVFSSITASNSNAFIIAGGGGGGAGTGGNTGYTGGAALNTTLGTASNGLGGMSWPVSGRNQFGYGASTTAVGFGGYAFDKPPTQNGFDGININGGAGGPGTIWQGAGGGGAGFFGGGGGAGGGGANGGGGGGSSKSSSGLNTFGIPNTTGDGSVVITCLSNSGLVLHLDAGNTASYPGSGTTWNDLSGNGSNVTLTSTSFSKANGGSIVFNGTSSYANFNANIGSTNAVTVDMWVRTNALTRGMYFGFLIYDVFVDAGAIGFNSANGDLFGLTSTKVNELGIQGAWRHLAFVMYANSKTNNKIFVNGVSQTLSQIRNEFSTVNSTFNAGAGRISSWRSDFDFLMNLNVASFKIYNRELTPQEITNNYNASKNRYNTIEFNSVGATTWTVPAGITSIEYLIVGGGGGGGNGYDNGAGGGGGGGMVLTGTLSVTPGANLNITVGDGGLGGANVRSNSNGTNGNNSNFSSIIALGGQGGRASRIFTTAGQAGVKQVGSTTSATGGQGGDVNVGGGGGGATANGTGRIGGLGFTSSISGLDVIYGNGGNGAQGSTNSTGNSGGNNTGQGGGAGSAVSFSSAAGGKGGSGVVILKLNY